MSNHIAKMISIPYLREHPEGGCTRYGIGRAQSCRSTCAFNLYSAIWRFHEKLGVTSTGGLTVLFVHYGSVYWWPTEPPPPQLIL